MLLFIWYGLLMQVESMFNEFEGRVVADLGCGTVSSAPAKGRTALIGELYSVSAI